MRQDTRKSRMPYPAARTLAAALTCMVWAASAWAQPLVREGVPQPANNLRDPATLIEIVEDGMIGCRSSPRLRGVRCSSS